MVTPAFQVTGERAVRRRMALWTIQGTTKALDLFEPDGRSLIPPLRGRPRLVLRSLISPLRGRPRLVLRGRSAGGGDR